MRGCGIERLPGKETLVETLERVAGHLEVSLTDDARLIALKLLKWRPDGDGAARILLSPRDARHLASLLIIRAEDAEEAGESLNTGATG
jgi:hypothetical protein